MFSYHKPLLGEPDFDSAEDLRLFRKRRVAIGYRVFAALGWGHTGDGHITARDPERTDHFWLLGHGVPFGSATVDKLVLVAPDGSVVEGDDESGYMPAAYVIHAPIHDARPDVVSAAHTHTPYGTPVRRTGPAVPAHLPGGVPVLRAARRVRRHRGVGGQHRDR